MSIGVLIWKHRTFLTIVLGYLIQNKKTLGQRSAREYGRMQRTYSKAQVRKKWWLRIHVSVNLSYLEFMIFFYKLHLILVFVIWFIVYGYLIFWFVLIWKNTDIQYLRIFMNISSTLFNTIKSKNTIQVCLRKYLLNNLKR